MGIKHFFMWFKNQFSEHTHKLNKNQTLESIEINIDNLMIDMNGIFHNSAQKIYEYGNHKAPRRLIPSRNIKPRQNSLDIQLKVFQDICSTVETIFNMTRPNKRLILCIDGPAPISKQNQQRQRRFRSAMEEMGNCPFNSNSITPGTKFMDFLSKYIDWFIRKKIVDDPEWNKVQIIMSNEKAPGEGEHKIINYIRYYGNKNETFCIHGLDADLIMLALGTHLPKFYILREDMYDPSNDYFCINVGCVHDQLVEIMRWASDKYTLIPNSAIDDFIFMCFMVGNDFLPHIPSIEIIEDGIELMIQVYKDVCSSYGHLTQNIDGKVCLIQKSMEAFLGTIGHHEKENFQTKLGKKSSFFPDPILEKCAIQTSNGTWTVDIEKYKTDYINTNFPKDYDVEKLCHEYLEGMQWVLSYYTRGVPNWKWNYKHHYAPPASILSQHLKTFVIPKYGHTISSAPFQQLLSVLPPKSASLIPEPLSKLLTDESSPLKEFCPDVFEIDLAGKRKEWEGIVILPMVDFNIVRDEYLNILEKVNPQDIKRNIIGRTFLYEKVYKYPYLFKSYYGNIENCTVKTTLIDL